MVMESTAADLPPKELAMVAVPADRGRSLLSRTGLPRLAISLAMVVVDVTVMVVEAACTRAGTVGCLYGACHGSWKTMVDCVGVLQPSLLHAVCSGMLPMCWVVGEVHSGEQYRADMVCEAVCVENTCTGNLDVPSCQTSRQCCHAELEDIAECSQ